MAVCLDYQSVYSERAPVVVSLKLHVVAGVLLLAALACKVWLKIEITAAGYQLAKARQEMVDLDMERRELELHRSFLLRPDRLLSNARERLGLDLLTSDRARRIS